MIEDHTTNKAHGITKSLWPNQLGIIDIIEWCLDTAYLKYQQPRVVDQKSIYHLEAPFKPFEEQENNTFHRHDVKKFNRNLETCFPVTLVNR